MYIYFLKQAAIPMFVIAMGFATIFYLYFRKEFPRGSRFLWGVILILLAIITVLSVKQLGVRLDTWFKDFLELKVDSSLIIIKITIESLSLLIPFCFGAVGSGLLSNALVQRESV